MNIYTRGLGLVALLAAVGGTALADNDSVAVPEVISRPTATKLEVAALASRIDQAVQKQLTEEKVSVSGLCSDAEFLRRVTLDLTGVIPAPEKVAAFLHSTEPNKRAKAIDELLASPGYGRHMADVWQQMLLPRVSDNRRLQSQPLSKWLEESFNANKPWNQTGHGTGNGLRQPGRERRRHLLPRQSDRGQDDRHGFSPVPGHPAAMRPVPQPSVHRLEADRILGHGGVLHQGPHWQFQAGRQERRYDWRNGRYRQQGQAEASCPNRPRSCPPSSFRARSRSWMRTSRMRPVLAKWLTSAENPFFAPAIVNRTWYHLFGRGFVNPVDDMHQDNPASHPELLKELSQQLIASGFDLKYLTRAICNSQTYQRTSKPVGENLDDTNLFSHMSVKVMTPGQLFDSLEAVIGKVQQQKGRGKKAQRTRRQPAATIRRLLPRRRRRRSDRVSSRHSAGVAADELAPTERQLGPAVNRRQDRRATDESDRAPLPGHAIAPADRCRDATFDGPRRQDRRQSQGLQRHPLGAAQLQRICVKSLTAPTDSRRVPTGGFPSKQGAFS